MKTKYHITLLICILFGTFSNAQILKNITDKLKGGTSEVAEENRANEINTAAKRAFYVADIEVRTFDKEKDAYTTNYFDADEIAM